MRSRSDHGSTRGATFFGGGRAGRGAGRAMRGSSASSVGARGASRFAPPAYAATRLRLSPGMLSASRGGYRTPCLARALCDASEISDGMSLPSGSGACSGASAFCLFVSLTVTLAPLGRDHARAGGPGMEEAYTTGEKSATRSEPTGAAARIRSTAGRPIGPRS
jgi:hypothetical protein